MQSMVGSSGRQRVQNSCFDDYFIAVPTDDVMKKFAQMTKPSFDKFKANTAESIALAELRDTLLPKLISGELRLDEVELAVEQEAVSAEQQNER
ncbi:restriction endonuclease subunit S [Vibrio cholerae]|nr:restriction endonuclease subunit S [Vibrio cholerae]